MEKRDCSETAVYKIQTPGNYPEKNIQHFRGNSCLPLPRYGKRERNSYGTSQFWGQISAHETNI
jgi:hypothetical protein